MPSSSDVTPQIEMARQRTKTVAERQAHLLRAIERLTEAMQHVEARIAVLEKRKD